MKGEYFEILAWILLVAYSVFSRAIKARRQAQSPGEDPAAESPTPSAPAPSPAPVVSAGSAGTSFSRPALSAPQPKRLKNAGEPARGRRPSDKSELASEVERARAVVARIRRLPQPAGQLAAAWFDPPLDAALHPSAGGKELSAQNVDWAARAEAVRQQREGLEAILHRLPTPNDRVSWLIAAHVQSVWTELVEFLERRPHAPKLPVALLPMRGAPTLQAAARLRAANLKAIPLPEGPERELPLLGLAARRAAEELLTGIPGFYDEMRGLALETLPETAGTEEELVHSLGPTLATHALAALVGGPIYLESLRRLAFASASKVHGMEQMVGITSEGLPALPQASFLGGLAAAAALRRGGMGHDAERILDAWRADWRDRGIDATKSYLQLGAGREHMLPLDVAALEREINQWITSVLLYSFPSLTGFTLFDVTDLAYSIAANARARQTARALRTGRAADEPNLRAALAGALFALESAPQRRPQIAQWMLALATPGAGAAKATPDGPAVPRAQRSTHSQLRRAVKMRILLGPRTSLGSPGQWRPHNL